MVAPSLFPHQMDLLPVSKSLQGCPRVLCLAHCYLLYSSTTCHQTSSFCPQTTPIFFYFHASYLSLSLSPHLILRRFRAGLRKTISFRTWTSLSLFSSPPRPSFATTQHRCHPSRFMDLKLHVLTR
eukprot:Pompholyxophrys_punicea_v1_NODE_405_length_2020_cov_5.457746.p3 type:complete len:126 gc:universal NODE_405_length_2020_cov_5.457746:1016-639(-)